jgi:hypothetical protein
LQALTDIPIVIFHPIFRILPKKGDGHFNLNPTATGSTVNSTKPDKKWVKDNPRNI